MATTVVGIFDDVRNAQQVIAALEGEGFNRDDISIVARSMESPASSPAADEGSLPGTDDQPDPTTGGAGTGALLGGTAGVVLGLAGLFIPGIGPLVAAGPLATAIAGAGIGATTGGILGALTTVNIPEDTAPYYAEAVHRGATLVAVTAPPHLTSRIEGLMQQHEAADIKERTASWRSDGWEGPAT